MKSKGSIQLFHTRVSDRHGCPHVGFVQSRGPVQRDIVPVFLEFNGMRENIDNIKEDLKNIGHFEAAISVFMCLPYIQTNINSGGFLAEFVSHVVQQFLKLVPF